MHNRSASLNQTHDLLLWAFSISERSHLTDKDKFSETQRFRQWMWFLMGPPVLAFTVFEQIILGQSFGDNHVDQLVVSILLLFGAIDINDHQKGMYVNFSPKAPKKVLSMTKFYDAMLGNPLYKMEPSTMSNLGMHTTRKQTKFWWAPTERPRENIEHFAQYQETP